MKPYETIKLEQWPDVGDIKCEGRKNSVGTFPSRNGRDYKPNQRAAGRKAIRRKLKRGDKAKARRAWQSEVQ